MKKSITSATEIVNTVGFALITGAIIYFIIGSVAGLVHGNMLDWTFCGSAHTLLHVDWCTLKGNTGVPFVDTFIHRLVNVTIPWFMLFWGFLLVALSTLGLKLLGHDYVPPGGKKD